MKNTFFEKRFFDAFSLAEALITLLIISVITIASIPVITKKKRNINDVPHGEWTCEINENGMHSSWSQDSPTPVVHSQYCEFIPPGRVTSFVVKAVGGGGGGGAGFSELKLDTLYPGDNRTIDFMANSKYDVVMVGGGGGGGGGNDERGGTRAHGGGSGAAVSFSLTPQYNISYSVNVGRGGSKGYGDDGKHSGGDGSNGGDTTFAGIVSAGGGTGGMAIQYNGAGRPCQYNKPIGNKVVRSGYGCGGSYSYSDPTGSFKITNVKSKNGADGTRNTTGVTTSYYSSVIGSNMLQATYSFPYGSYGTASNLSNMKSNKIGQGGIGGQGKNGHGTDGVGGYAAIKSDILVAGSAGQAAQPVIYPSAIIKDKIKVYLGKGGQGGKNTFTSTSHTSTEPSDGTSTRVGDILTAPFGRAGQNKTVYPSTTTATYIAGENGPVSGFDVEETPSFGGRSIGTGSMLELTSNARPGTSFGGGGGGGGAKRASAYGNECYSTVYSGNGADGANGKVIIKW